MLGSETLILHPWMPYSNGSIALKRPIFKGKKVFGNLSLGILIYSVVLSQITISWHCSFKRLTVIKCVQSSHELNLHLHCAISTGVRCWCANMAASKASSPSRAAALISSGRLNLVTPPTVVSIPGGGAGHKTGVLVSIGAKQPHIQYRRCNPIPIFFAHSVGDSKIFVSDQDCPFKWIIFWDWGWFLLLIVSVDG
jgi:hypothetical protein